jgi:hypothetical protein
VVPGREPLLSRVDEKARRIAGGTTLALGRPTTAFLMARAGGRAQARAQAAMTFDFVTDDSRVPAEHGASTAPSPTSGEGTRSAGGSRAPQGWGNTRKLAVFGRGVAGQYVVKRSRTSHVEARDKHVGSHDLMAACRSLVLVLACPTWP